MSFRKLVKPLKFLALPLVGILLLFFSSNVSAQEDRWYVYDHVKVDLNIDKTSEVTVNETFTYEFHGTYRGVFRDITLSSDADRILCQNDPNLQCGGFDRLELLEVYDNEGNILPENAYTVEEVYDDVYQERRFKVTWVFDENGRNFNGEKFNFGLKYKVYRSIGYFDDYDLLYWNALFPDREVNINSSEVNITFPEPLAFDAANLNVLYGEFTGFTYGYNFNEAENKLTLTSETLYPGQDFTVLYKLPKGMIDQPPTVKINAAEHQTELKFYENGNELDYSENLIEFDKAGQYTITAKAFGYSDQQFNLDLENGETAEITVELKPTLLGLVLFYGLIVVNCLSLLAIPGAIIFVYMQWRKKGRDKGADKTIVPDFEPPDEISSYMLGSMKDEKVDMVDISSIIIDLAYRGYIKIIEQKGSGLFASDYYEFKKLKEADDLNEVEKKVMYALFKSGDSTTTKALTNNFYTHIPSIQNSIYDEMVERNYFEKSPKGVRSTYVGIGIGLLILGMFMTIFLGALFIPIHYLLSFGTVLGIALGTLGISYLIAANFMPAKTEFGKEVLQKIKGFRMFIYHADRYRLQNLTPDMFERFLSYAVVFGLEKQWGEAFKDIYKGQPDWYEGNRSTFNSVIFANSLNNMMSTTSTALATSPSSSGSSGGGWSGGGGFSGGFSGGGGGGGGGGAF